MSNYRKILLDNLFYLMGQRKWTMMRLSIEGDISFSTIRTFLYVSENMPKVETIEKVARAFGLSVSDMLDPDLTRRLKVNEQFEISCADAMKELEEIEQAIASIKTVMLKNSARINECVKHNSIKRNNDGINSIKDYKSEIINMVTQISNEDILNYIRITVTDIIKEDTKVDSFNN